VPGKLQPEISLPTGLRYTLKEAGNHQNSVMDYTLQLRQYIGHRPILMVGAAVLVLDGQNRLLMMKRSDSGYWGIPGGATEPGEVIEDAARRETFEETNLEIGEMSLFGVFSGPELYYKYPNGDEVYNVTIAYMSRDWRGEIKLNNEHSEWKWFSISDIPDDISPPIRPVIGQFKSSFSKRNASRNT
jgi:ADP-ribose pyrophosphatase YjhB (NUDIX family)